MIRKSIFAVAAMSAFTSSALADETVMVDRGLMGDPAYVETVEADINAAARKVCRAEYRGATFYQRSNVSECIEDTVARAFADLHEPQVTAGNMPEERVAAR